MSRVSTSGAKSHRPDPEKKRRSALDDLERLTDELNLLAIDACKNIDRDPATYTFGDYPEKARNLNQQLMHAVGRFTGLINPVSTDKTAAATESHPAVPDSVMRALESGYRRAGHQYRPEEGSIDTQRAKVQQMVADHQAAERRKQFEAVVSECKM